MGKLLATKCRQCRREGTKLYLKGERCFSNKCAIVRRNTVPGVHGPKRRGRLSDYGTQLREKQKAKRTYGILERQFRHYYEMAKKQHGKTGEEMLSCLERRLDNVVYRAGLASSRSQARQLVSHGHFLVNDRAVNIPSYQIVAGEKINVKPQKKSDAYWTQQETQSITNAVIPSWLTADVKKGEITVQALPIPENTVTDLQMNLIIEFYSR